ncbi:FlgN protein [compost metagenome]
MAIEDLLEMMNKLQEAHVALLDLTKDKTRIIVSNQVEQLNQIVNKENKLLRHIGELDQQRMRVVNEYLISRGYTPNPRISVSDLVKVIFKAEDKIALAEAQKSLLSLIDQLKEHHALNQQLIEQSLAFIDYSLDLVMGAPEDDAIYRNPMQQRNTNRSGVFDTKA